MRRGLGAALGAAAVLALVLLSVLLPALNESRFERALLATVNREAVGMSESDLTAFARETIGYLRGQKHRWQPQTPFDIPPGFQKHMADVRIWVRAAALLAAGLLLAVLIGARHVSGRSVLAGALGLLGLIGALLVWAVLGFDSLWMLLHRVFIPDGIFPADEPVMQLFPLALFFSYVGPVAAWLAGLGAAALGAGWLFWRRRYPKPEQRDERR